MSDAPSTTTTPAVAVPAVLPAPPTVKEDEEYVYFLFGKEEVPVPPLSFYALKKCWEKITVAAGTDDTIIRVGCVLDCVEAALGDTDHPRTAEDLSKKLTAKGWAHLTAAYGRLLVMSGLLSESALLPDQEAQQSTDGNANTDPNAVGGGGQDSSTSSSGVMGVEESVRAADSLSMQVVNGPTSLQ